MQINKDTMREPSTTIGGHIEGLDGLRGIAVIGVILYHLFPNVIKGGFLGVPLFFVLSGYLIARISDCEWNEKQFHVLHFYRKRVVKIYPPLLIVIFITAGLIRFFDPSILNGIKEEIFSILLGYNNLWQIAQNSSYFTKIINTSPFTHLWSLSIELQFYLIWPVLFLVYNFLRKSKFSKYSSWLFALFTLISVIILQLTFQPGNDVTNAYYGTASRMFSLFMGAFMGIRPINKDPLKPTEGKRQKIIYTFGFLMFLMLLSFVVVDGQADITYRVGLLATSFLFCGILKLVLNTQLPFGKWLDCRPLSWIGKRSYEIYLWQYPIIFIFQYLKLNQMIISALIICIIILLLSTWLYELLKVKIKFGNGLMKFTTKVVFGVMTLLCTFVFILGGCSVISSPSTKKESQEQLQRELKENSKKLQEQRQQGQKKEPEQQPEQQPDQQGQPQPGQAPNNKEESLGTVTVIGDSVLLGAAPSIQKALPGTIIDAEESRQVVQAEGVIDSLDSEGKLGDTVIIALGANGTFQSSIGQSLIDRIGKERKIYWITVYGSYLPWQDDSNKAINKVAEENDNVHIIDWAEAAVSHKEWFYDDGIHLNTEGQKAYTDLILNSIN